jgi:hypothetical protein
VTEAMRSMLDEVPDEARRVAPHRANWACRPPSIVNAGVI